MTAPRRVGLALIGVLGVVLAIASGTAFASPGQPAGPGMAGMTAGGHGHTGTTKGWYRGNTVTARKSPGTSPPTCSCTSPSRPAAGVTA
ncbi:MAG TPA: hypothetical protein VKS82_06130 [Streptosporangiaceae bacterium]|nr:hypothetical protein [Streptosporangiaceae bacterium]